MAPILLLLAPAVALYVAFIARSPIDEVYALFDDAMVSMQYADNLVAGRGLTWSGGERVEGYSNFLWTLAMGGVHLLGLPDSTVSLPVMVLGAVVLVLGALVVRRIVLVLAPEASAAALAAMTLVALAYPLVYWALRGMEVGLAALLVSAMVLFALERRTVLLAITIGAALLTRDDLLVPAVVVLAWLGWTLPPERRLRVLLPVACTAAAVLAAHSGFRLAYYDSLLPNTYYLKLEGIGLGTRLERGFVALAYSSLRDLWAPLLLAGTYLALRRRDLPRGAVLLAGVFVAQCAYSVYVGADAFEGLLLPNRYLSTALPALLVLAVLGAVEVARNRRAALVLAAVTLALAPLIAWDGFPAAKAGIPAGDGFGAGRIVLAAAFALVLAALALRRTRPLIPVAVVSLLVLLAVSGPGLRDWLRSNYQGREFDVSWVRTGLALHDATPPDATVATSAAGNIVYFSDRAGVDLLGKADAVVAHGPPAPGQPFRPGHNKMNLEHSIGSLRPTVVVQPPAAPAELCRLARWGYEQAAPAVYVRSGARGIRTDVLNERARAIPMLEQRYPDPPEDC